MLHDLQVWLVTTIGPQLPSVRDDAFGVGMADR